MSVGRILDDKGICVCAGPGGVGKTTACAAIALGMAARGRKVGVVTIDPAKRLASALGLPQLESEERLVDPERFAAAGLPIGGELWAMTLDPKGTFDELVERFSPDPRTRDQVLSNRIYRELSSAVAGSQEYMAAERLLQLHEEARYDLLLLDTPPTRNALAFLDAPGRLSRFVDSRAFELFTGPGRKGVSLAGRGSALVFTVLKRITGVDMLHDLSDFFQSVSAMAERLSERAARATELLSAERTTFLVVSSPRRDSAEEAISFHRRLLERRMPFGGTIVNRMSTVAPDGLEGRNAVEDELASMLGRSLARRVARNLADYRALARRDAESVALLEGELRPAPLITVPHLDEDVHDVRGLVEMSGHLFGSGLVPSGTRSMPRTSRSREA